MCRALCVVSVVLVVGCALPPERQPPPPLPEGGPVLPYADVIQRARTQAANALGAFYVNKWSELEKTALDLEKTAEYLSKLTDVPGRVKDRFAVEAGDLGKEAARLAEAAKAKDVKQANESLQRINLKVRELRAQD